jgi:hypothetical protein
LLTVAGIGAALSFHDAIHRHPRDHIFPVPGRALQWATVQILHPFAGSIQQYAEEITDPDRYRPNHCPQCQAQHSLTAHGFYCRTLVDVGFDGSIRVRRYLCHSCKRTVSLLPQFALNRELNIMQSIFSSAS